MKLILKSIALIAAIVGAVPCYLLADAPTKKSPVVITIELASPSQAITLRSSNVFKVTISNMAPFPLYIFKKLEFGTTVSIQNSSRKEIEPRVIGDLCPPPPPHPGENIWRKIEPGESVSTLYERSIEDLGITKRGHYFATAYYFRYLTRDPEHDHPSLRDNPLVSAPIKFIVQ